MAHSNLFDWRQGVVYVIFLLSLFLPRTAVSQSIDQIKDDRSTYIWGEGSGTTINKADQLALEMLIGQISVEVESKFSLLKEEVRAAGKSNFKEECHQMVNTYSSATLTNTERVVIGNEPDAKVFRYMKRSDIAMIFQQRKQKIIDFTANADKALQNNQLSDALKYYYWALSLLRSHPEGNAIAYTPSNGIQGLLLTYLPQQMNTIFTGLDYTVTEVKDEPGQRSVVIDISYNGQPVQNLEYSYWDGRDWSAPVGAKDGVGFMDFYGDNASSRIESQVRAEYIFEGEARVDRELEDVLKRLDPIPFHNSYYDLRFDKKSRLNKPVIKNAVQPVLSPNPRPGTSALSSLGIRNVPETFAYQQIVDQIVSAVQQRQYEKVKPLFTPGGYDVFTRLIGYGKARVLSNDSLRAIRLNDMVICRGPKMSFEFSNNNRKFVEDVVFHFNQQRKVETLSFGLNQQALESILSQTSWSEAERLALINFMEHYKTAYALKRLDYISSIFSDDALIITGSVLKVKPNIENPFSNNSIVKYNRYNKTQYLKALEHTFSSNEFINLSFEDCDVVKGEEGDRFGIKIKQNYFSTNYGDQGYLFLLMDFKNPDEPIIHVRTWQPQKNNDGSIYGIENF